MNTLLITLGIFMSILLLTFLWLFAKLISAVNEFISADMDNQK